MVKPLDQNISRKDRILQAAGELIVEVGWANVTTRLIAKQAGVNNALIHYYFGTKDDLLFEAAGAVFAGELSGPLEALSGAEHVADTMRELFSWLHSLDVRSPMMVVSMEVAHQAVRDERARAWMRSLWTGYLDVFAGIIASAQQRDEFPESIDPRGAAIAIGALLDGLFLYRLADPDLEIDRVVSALSALTEIMTKGNQ